MRALLLAGGEGKRLRPLTNKLPKCMMPIQGRPLLDIKKYRSYFKSFDKCFLQKKYSY